MGCASSKLSKDIKTPQPRSFSVYNTTTITSDDKTSPPSIDKITNKLSLNNLQCILAFPPSLIDTTKSPKNHTINDSIILHVKCSVQSHCKICHLSSTFPAKSFNFLLGCKKGIKYTSRVALTETYAQNLNQNKVEPFLKRVKICKSFNVHKDIKSLPLNQKLRLRKMTFSFAKSIKTIGSCKINKNLSHLKHVQTGSVDYISQTRFLPSMTTLKVSKPLYQDRSCNEKAIKNIPRLRKLQFLQLQTESLSLITINQRDLSRAIKKLSQLKAISLKCSLNSRPTQTIKCPSPPEIYPRLPFWQKITNLSLDLSNNSTFPLKTMLSHIKRFESLTKLSLKLKPESSQEFEVYQKFSALEQIKELCLEVKMCHGSRKEGIKFFENISFPKGLRTLDIKLTSLRKFSILSKTSSNLNFLDSLESLRCLSTFRFRVKGKEAHPKPSKIRSPFVFFHYLIKRLPCQLQNLALSAHNSTMPSCWSPMISQDTIITTISERLSQLEALKINILGINLAPENLARKVLPKLKKISLGNLMLSAGLFSNFNAQRLEEFKFSCCKEIEITELEWFLREIAVFTSLKTLNIKVSKLKKENLTSGLARELLKMFQNLDDLRDLSVILPCIMIGAEAGKWFLGLCHYKTSLKTCKFEFEDYKVTKDIFTVSVSNSL